MIGEFTKEDDERIVGDVDEPEKREERIGEERFDFEKMVFGVVPVVGDF
jgi:hypothetical protein